MLCKSPNYCMGSCGKHMLRDNRRGFATTAQESISRSLRGSGVAMLKKGGGYSKKSTPWVPDPVTVVARRGFATVAQESVSGSLREIRVAMLKKGGEDSKKSNPWVPDPEDDVQKISTSVFITNFPDSFSAKDLFKTCSQYGNVVQRTPMKKDNIQAKNKYEENRSNTRDHNKDNRVIGFAKSYTNAVKGGTQSVNVEEFSNHAMVLEDDCLNLQDLDNSLMGRVKEFASLSNMKKVLDNEGFSNIEIAYLGELWVLLKFTSEESNKLFLDNTCVGTWFSKLQQASMGFNIDERITWVEIECIPFKLWSENTLIRITSRWGVLLHVDDQEDLQQASMGFNIDERITWVEIECIPFKLWSENTLIRVTSRWGVLLHVDDQEDIMKRNTNLMGESMEGHLKGDDVVLKNCSIIGEDTDVDEVSETKFKEGSHNSIREDVSVGQRDIHSKDPFQIYEFLNKKKEDINKCSSLDSSMKYPPGFTPNEDMKDQNKKDGESEKESGDCSHKLSKKGPNEDIAESICSGHFKRSEIPRTWGSILNLMDELVKVGQIMGYNMDGCSKNMKEIIQSQGANDGYK
ncbi:nucleotide-binding alpha-beta plait domain-containing protein [Tanacetum coccineum]